MGRARPRGAAGGGERVPLLPQVPPGPGAPLGTSGAPLGTSGAPLGPRSRPQGPGSRQRPHPVGVRRAPSAFSRCVRHLAFLWNLLFLLLGLLVLAMGVWGLLAKGSEAGMSSDPMLVLVLVGLSASTVSMTGCLGALRSSRCLLRCFVGAVLGLAGLEVLAAVLVLAARHRLRDELRDLLLLCLLRYPDEPDLRLLVDELQQGLRCCGLGSYRDWESNP
uniref:Uncharacterized protein n=1 Tax=Melopsittacus undulatus TaxID=13146 RepID=A0A8C6IQB7_MELUD